MVIFLEAFAFSFAHLGDLKFVLSTEDLVDDGFSSAQGLKDMQKWFGTDVGSILILPKPADGWTESKLCRIWEWYTD